jgi:hypothetical protein
MKNFLQYAKHGLRLKFYNRYDAGTVEFKFSPNQINSFHYWLEDIKRNSLRYEVLSIRDKILEQG